MAVCSISRRRGRVGFSGDLHSLDIRDDCLPMVNDRPSSDVQNALSPMCPTRGKAVGLRFRNPAHLLESIDSERMRPLRK